MEELGSWVNHAAVGSGLLFAAIAAIPGVLALMKDTPESQRLRGWFKQTLGLFWVVAPGLALAIGFPIAACVLASTVALQHAIIVGRAGGATSPNMLMLVVMVLFACSSFTILLVDRMIALDQRRDQTMERVIELLEKSQGRVERIERELEELRAVRSAR